MEHYPNLATFGRTDDLCTTIPNFHFVCCESPIVCGFCVVLLHSETDLSVLVQSNKEKTLVLLRFIQEVCS